MFQCDFARHLTEQHDIINRFQRIIECQRIFKLWTVVFAGDHIQRKSQLFRAFPNRVVET